MNGKLPMFLLDYRDLRVEDTWSTSAKKKKEERRIRRIVREEQGRSSESDSDESDNYCNLASIVIDGFMCWPSSC